jgi:hypothetical protein
VIKGCYRLGRHHRGHAQSKWTERGVSARLLSPLERVMSCHVDPPFPHANKQGIRGSGIVQCVRRPGYRVPAYRPIYFSTSTFIPTCRLPDPFPVPFPLPFPFPTPFTNTHLRYALAALNAFVAPKARYAANTAFVERSLDQAQRAVSTE